MDISQSTVIMKQRILATNAIHISTPMVLVTRFSKLTSARQLLFPRKRMFSRYVPVYTDSSALSHSNPNSASGRSSQPSRWVAPVLICFVSNPSIFILSLPTLSSSACSFPRLSPVPHRLAGLHLTSLRRADSRLRHHPWCSDAAALDARYFLDWRPLG